MTFLQLCSSLDRLSREHNIDPPKMTLTFATDAERKAFEWMVNKEFAPLTAFAANDAKLNKCHGITFEFRVAHIEALA